MNKETFQQRKMEALCSNIGAFAQDLRQNSSTLFANPAIAFIEKQEIYSQKHFE